MRITLLILGLIFIVGAVVFAADPGPNLEEKAIKKVPPVYPPLARRRRVEGKVIIKLQVGRDGVVSSAEFMEGNSLFKPSSLEAAHQWAFQKSDGGMNGHIAFKFMLQED